MSNRPIPKALLTASCLAWSSAFAAVPTSSNALPVAKAVSAGVSAATGERGSITTTASIRDNPAPNPALADPSLATPAKDSTNHPFRQIAARNAFGIKPPPPPAPAEPEVPKAPPTPPPNVFLTGFSSWKDEKKVYLQVTRPNNKVPDYLELRVGEQQFDIKVLEINDRQEFAKILNGDQEVVLNFRDNGLKATGNPGPGIQGIPNPANGGITAPRLAGQPNPQSAPASGGPAYIGRGGTVNVNPVVGGGGIAAVQPGGAMALHGADLAGQNLQSIPARRGNVGGGVEETTQSPNTAPPTSVPNPRIINRPPPPPLPVYDGGPGN